MYYIKYRRRAITFIVALIVLILQMPAANAGTEIPEGFSKAAENNTFILLLKEEEGEMAVTDKRTGLTWFSNPQDRKDDKISRGIPKMALSSQLTVEYVNAENVKKFSTSKASVINKKGLAAEFIDNGVVIKYDFVKEEFSIPIKITIENDKLKVEILLDSINEYGENRILTINLLPYFGAGGLGDTGYNFVPDGCGALIYFNNGKHHTETYFQRVYGLNKTIFQDKMVTNRENIHLPVFGVKKNSSAFLAVISGSQAKSIIKASVSGKTSSYNNVHSCLEFRESGSVEIMDKSFDPRNVYLVEDNPETGKNYVVSYYFLNNDQADYSGMANAYRNILKREGGLKPASFENIPLYIDIYGSIMKKKSFLGIPYQSVIPLTTFDQCKEIMNALKRSGVDKAVVRFNGWVKDGYYEKIPTSLSIERKLGSMKDMKKLSAWLEQSDYEFFPAVDLLNVYRTGGGFSKFLDAAKNFTGLPALQHEYLLNTYIENEDINPWYLLSPRKFLDKAKKLLKNYDKIPAENIALSSLGTMLYSDLGGKGIGSVGSMYRQVECLEYIKDKTSNIMLQAANDYAMASASHIVHIPVRSSRYDIEDEEVPFYQMVLHGFIPYAASPLNLQEDPELFKLKLIETGCSPLYAWIYSESSKLKETRLQNLYSGNYRTWLEDAINIYAKMNNSLSCTVNKEMMHHSKKQEGVYVTEYEGGCRVVVNYNDTNVIYEGNTINARDYLVFREEGE